MWVIGLEGVKDAEHFPRVAADIQIIGRDEADDALGVDDDPPAPNGVTSAETLTAAG